MSIIIESIREAKKRGVTDDKILQEIIRQNPIKGKVFNESLKKGDSPTEILEELIRREGKTEIGRIEEAKKRIEALKKFKESAATGEDKQVKPAETIKVDEVQKGNKEEEQKITIEEKERQELLRRLRGDKEEVREPVPIMIEPKKAIRTLPKKPSPKAKLWLRIIIVALSLIILSGVATFWYWFLVARKQPPIMIICSSDADCAAGQTCNSEGNCVNASAAAKCVGDADCPSGQICNTEGACVKKPSEAAAPPALFSIAKTRTLEFSSSEELRSLLSQALREWQDKGKFIRLVIKNSKNNTILGLKEFFEALLVRVPDGFYQKVDNDFTLFIYSQDQGNRLGFVTKIKNYEGMENLLREQEPKMEDDFQTFFVLMKKETPAIVPYFRNASNVRGYVGPNFRYQTLNRQDLGILYLTSGDYFLFTSSWKSMEEAIKRLGITQKRLELTADLKMGDKGYEVKLLQTWLAQDATVYPRAIINGNFGRLTKAAVIRFQEKYASEILAPQGLIKGNGIVDSYTRIKLNELYGDSGIKPRMAELTTDLRVGSYGEEVKLLQSWLAKDRQIYPKGIVSGYFGYLTKQALVRFQEKYASEILTPQGLSKGTGIVDTLTRKKLNNLYGGK